MKKVLAVLILVCFGLVGCGKSNAQSFDTVYDIKNDISISITEGLQMAKLNALEVNHLKATIEGSHVDRIYNRLEWDTPKTLRLSASDKEDLDWFLSEDEMLDDEAREIIERIVQ